MDKREKKNSPLKQKGTRKEKDKAGSTKKKVAEGMRIKVSKEEIKLKKGAKVPSADRCSSQNFRTESSLPLAIPSNQVRKTDPRSRRAGSFSMITDTAVDAPHTAGCERQPSSRPAHQFWPAGRMIILAKGEKVSCIMFFGRYIFRPAGHPTWIKFGSNCKAALVQF